LFNTENLKKYYKCSTLFVTIIAIAFFIQTAIRHFNSIPLIEWDYTAVLITIITIILYVANIGIGSANWYFLLSDYSTRLAWKNITSIFFISQFGKYLPGNVGHYIGRVVIAKSSGLNPTIVIATIFIESIWSICTAVIFVFLLYFLGGIPSFDIFDGLNHFLLASSFFFILFLPWIGISGLNFLSKKLPILNNDDKLVFPKFKTALIVSILFTISFLLMGLIMKLQSNFFFHTADVPLLKLSCILAFAWLVGYLMPGSPGGIGVREAVLLLMLSPLFGQATAVGLGVTLRITSTMGDAIAFALGWGLKKLTLGQDR